jgi:hypothetical protein
MGVWRQYAHHLKVKGLARDYHDAVLGTRGELAGSWFMGGNTLAQDLAQLSRLDDVKARDYSIDVTYVNPNGIYFPIDFKTGWLPTDNLLVNKKQAGACYVLLTLQRGTGFSVDEERDLYFDVKGYCPDDKLQPAKGRFGNAQWFCPQDLLNPIDWMFTSR